ncbi:hypothetical protein SLA2020_391750 [Shorea laevis]
MRMGREREDFNIKTEKGIVKPASIECGATPTIALSFLAFVSFSPLLSNFSLPFYLTLYPLPRFLSLRFSQENATQISQNSLLFTFSRKI